MQGRKAIIFNDSGILEVNFAIPSESVLHKVAKTATSFNVTN